MKLPTIRIPWALVGIVLLALLTCWLWIPAFVIGFLLRIFVLGLRIGYEFIQD